MRVRTLLMAVAAAILFVATTAQADEWVNGYARRDGTWVNGYWRTTRNYTMYDNYSTFPNVNPYTGTTGTRFRYSYPTYTPVFRTSEYYSPYRPYTPYAPYNPYPLLQLPQLPQLDE